MSNDHKDSGWRKRQIALDIKAENARELGLDYGPSIIEMARRAGAVFPADGSYHQFERHEDLETFAALVRADEREACAKLRETLHPFDLHNRSEMLGVMNQGLDDYAAAIRARGQA